MIGRRPTSRIPRPWRRSKKLRRARGGSPRGARPGHTDRSVVPGRDAGRPEEQAHLSLGEERLASPRHSRSTHAIDYLFGAVCPEHGTGAGLVLPACNSEAMQLHLNEIATKVTPGAHAMLLLDQAGWHGAAILT